MFMCCAESSNENVSEHFLHMADVNTAEYFMTDAYVKVAMVMVSAGTLLCAQLYSVLI